MNFLIELEGVEYPKSSRINDDAQRTASSKSGHSIASAAEAENFVTETNTDIEAFLPKSNKQFYIALLGLGAILSAAVGVGAAKFYISQKEPGVFVANEQTPVIKQGNEPAAEEITIPSFISADRDCERVVIATVAPFTYTDSSNAKLGKTTINDQPYTVDGNKSKFTISTCGLEQLPVSDTNTELHGSPVAQIDISGLLPIVKPTKGNKAPSITPETTQTTLTDNGYGEQEALCTFIDNILGCNGDVIIPAEEVKQADTKYTAIAANLALEKCGTEAFASSLKRLANAAQSPQYASVTLTTAGMNDSDYVNKGAAAIAEASVVGIEELAQESLVDMPDVECKVTED